MENFKIVVDCFSYLLDDTEVDFRYVQKLYLDTRHALRDEDIYVRMKRDENSGDVLMMLSDLGTGETVAIFSNNEEE